MEKLNLIPILENCPKGMELDCTLFHDVRFDYIDKEDNNYPIRCFIETKYGNNTIGLNKYGEYHINSKSKCVIFPKGKTSWEGFTRPFKAGDIVAGTVSEGTWIGIFAQYTERGFESYCSLNLLGEFRDVNIRNHGLGGVRLATEEEKEKLFDAIKANGFNWNPKTKVLEEIEKPTFTITKIENPKADWKRVLKATRKTVGKKDIDKEPSDEFKKQMLLAEHSPIRLLEYDIDIDDVAQWVTVHYVRHHVGIEKFIHTQRTDRNPLLKGLNRDELPQGMLTNMMLSCNAQSMINVSRKRLCSKASLETREVWKAVLAYLEKLDPILVEKCVPECVYRGFCPEKKCCGFVNTTEYLDKLNTYRQKHDDTPKQD